MSNNKFDATFFDPKPGTSGVAGKQEKGRYEKRPAARKLRGQHVAAKPRRKPVVYVVAGVILAALVILPVSCGISAHNAGVAYDACIQKIAQEDGHDQAVLAMEQGECR